MKRMTATAAAIFIAVFALFAVTSKAQDFNPLERTFLTFSAPVELPGMTLPAGTYTFRLADTPSRNVVQVLSRDEKTIHGQFLFQQAQRRDPAPDTIVMFRESAEGTTPAVRYWFYPGESIGKEFIYPKDQATKIAARTHTPVLAAEGDIAANPRVATVDEQGNVTPVETQSASNEPSNSVPQPVAVESRAQGVAPQPAAAPAAQAPAPARAPVAQAPRNDTDNRVATSELPRTASPFPLTGLIGLLSLAGGLGLRLGRS